jgi:hypothetical protein
MLKKFLTIVLPIALPFIAYVLYAVAMRRRSFAAAMDLRHSPWPWLGLAGFALMAATLIGWRFVFTDPGGPGATVIPNRYIDGEIQPYRILEPDDSGESDAEREGSGPKMPAETR